MTTPSHINSKLNIRTFIGVLFLIVQVAFIIQAQFLPTRWFCWAPNDYATEYQLSVVLNGRALTPEEITQRYKLPDRGIKENKVEHITIVVQQYEETYGKANPARVTLTYSFNGGSKQEWHWPSQ